MVEPYLRQSPLAHLGLAARAEDGREVAGIVMGELRHRGIVDLRGKADAAGFAAAATTALGFALPTEAGIAADKGDVTALWQGPDEWWIVTSGGGGEEGADMVDRLRKALDGQQAAVTEIGESRCCIRVAGPHARDLLAKGCPLDLHPRVFGAGRCAGSLLAKAGVTLHLVSDGPEGPAFEVYVLRSFADYLWRWLEDAAQEYGMVVAEG